MGLPLGWPPPLPGQMGPPLPTFRPQLIYALKIDINTNCTWQEQHYELILSFWLGSSHRNEQMGLSQFPPPHPNVIRAPQTAEIQQIHIFLCTHTEAEPVEFLTMWWLKPESLCQGKNRRWLYVRAKLTLNKGSIFFIPFRKKVSFFRGINKQFTDCYLFKSKLKKNSLGGRKIAHSKNNTPSSLPWVLFCRKRA